MKREDLAARVLALVTEIAPDVDPATVIPGIDFRDQFDFDSMDTLNFAIALHRELGRRRPGGRVLAGSRASTSAWRTWRTRFADGTWTS